MRITIATAGILALGSAGTAQYGIDVETVILTQQPPFGAPSEIVEQLDTPTINNNGVVAFSCTVRPNPSTLLDVAYVVQDGVGTEIARQGQFIPELPFLTYTYIETPRVDESGFLAFLAGYSATGNSTIVVSGWPGRLALTALSGPFGPSPSNEYVQFLDGISSLLLSRGGKLAFRAGPQSVAEIWSGTHGSLQMVAGDDIKATGYPFGTTVAGYGWMRMAESGDVFSSASLYGAGFTGETALVLAGLDDAVQIIGAPGFKASGLDGAYSGFSPLVSTNGAGILVFNGGIVPSGGGSPLAVAWIGSPSKLQPMVIAGTAAPGLPRGFVFSLISGAVVNSEGHAAVLASAVRRGRASDQHYGVWLWFDGQLELVTRLGDQIDNLEPDTELFSIGIDSWTDFAVNALDQIAFIGQVRAPGREPEMALLATTPTGTLLAVARVGDLFVVGPDDERVVTNIAVRGGGTSGGVIGLNGDDGWGTFFNDHGELAFVLGFDDETWGMFVAAVPTPVGVWSAHSVPGKKPLPPVKP